MSFMTEPKISVTLDISALPSALRLELPVENNTSEENIKRSPTILTRSWPIKTVLSRPKNSDL